MKSLAQSPFSNLLMMRLVMRKNRDPFLAMSSFCTTEEKRARVQPLHCQSDTKNVCVPVTRTTKIIHESCNVLLPNIPKFIPDGILLHNGKLIKVIYIIILKTVPNTSRRLDVWYDLVTLTLFDFHVLYVNRST